MKHYFLVRYRAGFLAPLFGLCAVLLFTTVVVLLLAPYAIVKMLACYTPVGRVGLPLALR